MNIIAFDIGSEVSAVCALKKSGSVLFEELVAMRIPALKSVLRQVPHPKRVVFEECPQAAWLYAELQSEVDEVFICDPRKNKELSSGKKSDRNDARNLAERCLQGGLSRVWHGGEELARLREAVAHYHSLTQHSTRLKNQFKAILRSRGVRGGRNPYGAAETLLQQLPSESQQQLRSLSRILEVLSEARKDALREMVRLARKHKCYEALRTVPGVGPVFCATLLAIIGDPERFRTRRQLWAYGGLSILTHETGEYRLRDGVIEKKRSQSRTRGLTRAFNRPLKCIFKQAALTLSRTAWKEYYEHLLSRSSNKNNAQLTLARKFAAVVLQVMKKREAYDVAKALKKY
jgi:transposase